MPPALAHALPQSVGAVPLTLIITVVFGLFLAVNAMGSRRTATAQHHGPSTPERRDSDHADHGLTTGQILGALGLVALGVMPYGRPDDPAQNGYDFYVLTVLWGVVGVSSIIVGSWWWRVDPPRGINGLLARSVGDPHQADAATLRQSTATAVAVIGLLGWAYVQVFLSVSQTTVQLLLVGYAAAHVVGATRYGIAWLQQTESLNVLSWTLGRLRPGSGGPVARLSDMADSGRGRWVSAVLIGWSLADLLVETDWWHERGLPSTTVAWLGLLVLVGFTTGLYALMRMTDNRLGLGPAFIAAAGGWVVSQYLSVLLTDLLGLGVELVAILQVVPFILAHLLASIVVLRRAERALQQARQVSNATFLSRGLLAGLLVGGVYLQLGGV